MSNNPFQPPSWWPHSAAAWNDIAEWFGDDNQLYQLADSSHWIKLTQGISNHCYRFSHNNDSTDNNCSFIKILRQQKQTLTPLTSDLASRLFSFLQQLPTLETTILKNSRETKNVQIAPWFNGCSLATNSTSSTSSTSKTVALTTKCSNKNSLLNLLCDSISKIHGVKIETAKDFEQWKLVMPEYIERYYQQALLGSPESSTKIESSYKMAIANAANFVPQCVCHNDLNPGNIMTAGNNEIRIVDWEYASIGDPLFDLAGLIITNGLPPSEENSLLERYSENMKNGLSMNKLTEMKRLFKSISELWHFVV